MKQNDKNRIYKIFYQKIFDLVFNKIELNMREIGFGETSINKNMRHLVKTFYNILLNCEKYKEINLKSKKMFFLKYLKPKGLKNLTINDFLIEYFNKYEGFCFDLSTDSVLKGELKFNYK